MILLVIKHYSFALYCFPDARKLHAKYPNLSQGNLTRVREMSRDFALFEFWTPWITKQPQKMAIGLKFYLHRYHNV